MKKTILHIINNFSRGGAETMLVAVLRELTEYNNIVVALEDKNHFEGELKCDKYICLNMPSAQSFPIAVVKLRKVIKEFKPDIVHSHLFWPTLIARLATPKTIPLINTIHTSISHAVEYKKWHVQWLDKFSYHFRKSIIIGVAKGPLEEYFSFLKLKPYKAYTLYTFVDTNVFNEANSIKVQQDENFRLISVGSLKEEKNHQYLIDAFKQLKNEKFELHIYGSGILKEPIEKQLEENNITAIVLKGMRKNVNEVIQQYDMFVMPSMFEGCSLAVLEAMALSRPLLLSDIPSFREQCQSAAEYFNLNDPNDFVVKLKNLSSDKLKLQQMGNDAKQRALANFTLQHHMKGLRSIYDETLSKQ